MRIHYLQHVPFEDAANIATWAVDRGHAISCTRLYDGEPLPSLDAFDWLVVMGGPMNIYEHDTYPWLIKEKKFIKQAIDGEKYLVGVCLGAQLIADVLGGCVTKNQHPEIGWIPISLTESGSRSALFETFPPSFEVFHWHGDTFSIPPDAIKLAESEACANQAFLYRDRVLGMQFHLDYSIKSIEKMLHHCSDELVTAPYIQSAAQISTSLASRVDTIRHFLYQVLDNLSAKRV